MKTLMDACDELELSLHDASRECQTLAKDLDEFQSNISVYPVQWLHLRLMMTAREILTAALSLYIKHESRGYVFFTMIDNVLGVQWTDNEELITDREWCRNRGTIMLLPNEIAAISSELANQLASGNCEDVVKWINDCGNCIVLD